MENDENTFENLYYLFFPDFFSDVGRLQVSPNPEENT